MAKDLATLGYRIEYLSDKDIKPNRTYDTTFDETPADIIRVGSHNNVKGY